MISFSVSDEIHSPHSKVKLKPIWGFNSLSHINNVGIFKGFSLFRGEFSQCPTNPPHCSSAQKNSGNTKGIVLFFFIQSRETGPLRVLQYTDQHSVATYSVSVGHTVGIRPVSVPMIWGTQRPGACSMHWVLAWNSSTLVRWRTRAGSSVSFSCSVRAWRCRNRACLHDTHSHSQRVIHMDFYFIWTIYVIEVSRFWFLSENRSKLAFW